MFKQISTRIAKWLLKQRAISSTDLDLYIYAIDTFIFSLIPLVLTVSIGLALNMLLESVLMILPFMLVRKFSGGFHLQSPIACLLWSSVLLLIILMLIKWSFSFGYIALCTVLTILSSLSLCLLSPIDSEQRKLSEKEKACFKHFTYFLVFVVDILYLIFCFAGNRRVAMSLGYGVFIPAFLQIPCLIQKNVRHIFSMQKRN